MSLTSLSPLTRPSEVGAVPPPAATDLRLRANAAVAQLALGAQKWRAPSAATQGARLTVASTFERDGYRYEAVVSGAKPDEFTLRRWAVGKKPADAKVAGPFALAPLVQLTWSSSARLDDALRTALMNAPRLAAPPALAGLSPLAKFSVSHLGRSEAASYTAFTDAKGQAYLQRLQFRSETWFGPVALPAVQR